MAKLPSEPNPGLGKRSAIGFLVGCALLLCASLLVVTSTAQQVDAPKTASSSNEVEASFLEPSRRLQSASNTRMARVFGGGGEGGGGGVVNLIIRLVFWLIWMGCSLVFAFVYKSKVVDMIPPLQPKAMGTSKDFISTLFQCCSNGSLCMHAWCCLPCRAGHTFQVAGVASYWVVVLVLELLPGCGCIFGFLWRQQLREKLGLQPDGCCDFVKWCCCTACAVGQEALDVDQAVGVDVACCCNLQMTPQAAMVGQPVQVGQAPQPGVIGGGGQVIVAAQPVAAKEA